MKACVCTYKDSTNNDFGLDISEKSGFRVLTLVCMYTIVNKKHMNNLICNNHRINIKDLENFIVKKIMESYRRLKNRRRSNWQKVSFFYGTMPHPVLSAPPK